MDGAAEIRAVLENVYSSLGLDWHPATVGDVASEAPGVSVEDVRRALLAEYGRRYELTPGAVGEPELARARQLLDRHRVEL